LLAKGNSNPFTSALGSNDYGKRQMRLIAGFTLAPQPSLSPVILSPLRHQFSHPCLTVTRA